MTITSEGDAHTVGTGRVTFRPVVCRRNSDGTLWVPSHPPGWTNAEALHALFAGNDFFYYVGIRKLSRWLPGIWVTTGRVWRFEDPTLLKVLTPRRLPR